MVSPTLGLIGWLDQHNAAVVAVATIALAIVTAIYVLLTHRLVRAQFAEVKREIVEKVYQPLARELDETLWGDWPGRVRDRWTSLQSEQPYLAYHHLIPDKIQRTLDRLGSDSTPAGDAYKTLSLAVNRLGRFIFWNEPNPPAEHISFRYVAGLLTHVDLNRLILAAFTPGRNDIDRLPGSFRMTESRKPISVQVMVANRILKEKEIEPTEVTTGLHSLWGSIQTDPALANERRTYTRFTVSGEKLLQRIRREIARGSAV